MEQSKPLELPKEWKDKIEANAKSVSGHQPNEDSTSFRNGMYTGYKSGSMAYATWLYTCQINYAALRAKCDRYEAALKIVQNWQLPPTGQFWDNEQTQPMSYGACYGSNGERDYMRNVANEALSAGEGEKIEQERTCKVCGKKFMAIADVVCSEECYFNLREY
jgi:hypothetical protein